MANAYVSGTGAYLPPRIVPNRAFKDEYGMDSSDEWIVQRTGIQTRRYADAGVATSDLALKASEEALRRASLAPSDLDLIVFATLSPDVNFPGAGVFLQRKLGMLEGDRPKFVPALDVRNQCSGFVYALAMGTSVIRAGSARHVLVVGAEVHSAWLDYTTRARMITPLFGDGAGAVVLSATDEPRGVLHWSLGADGRYAEALGQNVWDMAKRPFIRYDAEGNAVIPPDDLYGHMDGKTVFKHAVERMSEVLVETCAAKGLTTADIDLFCFHQANLRINQFVAEKLRLPSERVATHVQRYGNTTAATVPILLAESEREGRLERGKRAAVVAFGSGFCWGCAIIDW